MGELEIFALRIKELREQLQMSQKDFSSHIGIKQQTLSGYERGIMKPPLDVAKNIAEKCNVSLDWLCGLQEMKKSEALVTYKDVFDLIINLVDDPNSDFWNISFYDSTGDCFADSPSTATISTCDSNIVHFFAEWEQLRKLYKAKTIDEHLYKLWLSDKLRQYKDAVLPDYLPFR